MNTKHLDFLSPLTQIPGLGQKRITALGESGIQTIKDLLFYFPKTYIDRSTIIPITELYRYINRHCTVIGKISKTGVEKGKKPRFRIEITDDTGSFEVCWFQGISFYRKTFHTGQKILLHGKIYQFPTISMVHPFTEKMGEKKTDVDIPFLPQYRINAAMKAAHLHQRAMFKAIHFIVKNLQNFPKILPEVIEKKKNFPSLATCLTQIHLPKDPQKLSPFYDRLRYEELYTLALTLRLSNNTFLLPGRSMKPGALPERLLKTLPFELTDDQNKAIAVLYSDAQSGMRMHRLLHGDVGSGKTIVALFACLPALNEGLQVVWAAPTEMLAHQTLQFISPLLSSFAIMPRLLTGSIGTNVKRSLYKDLSQGTVQFVVGTHALFQRGVTFYKIGMVIIDEQHKFGVQQRLLLQQKDYASDFLCMSATPIPQTLIKTMYGDLDTVAIRSTPKGKIRVNTYLVPEKKRHDMEHFITTQIHDSGAQVFCIVPRIDSEEDQKNSMENIDSVCFRFTHGLFSTIPFGAVHGKTPPSEKVKIMDSFVQGSIKILVATTVIEVGIDVPQASIMIIENAERFGLSQLHQLRGRVGRDGQKAYVFLFSKSIDNEITKKRLTQFCRIHDGFAIAELDLSLRGPGEIGGIRQSGWDTLQIADILTDADLFREIQREIDMHISA